MRWDRWQAGDLWFNPARQLGAGNKHYIYGTAGDDSLVGGDGKDVFRADQGGDDTLSGGGGADEFVFATTYTPADFVDGGDGRDQLSVYSYGGSAIELDPSRLVSVEVVAVHGGSVVVDDGFTRLQFDARLADRVRIDASALTTGTVDVIGGEDADKLTGGSGNDEIDGRVGGDVLIGGAGNDRFVYRFAQDSESRYSGVGGVDTIRDYSKGDFIFLPTAYGIDFHIGKTQGHTGDVVAAFNAETKITTLDIFLDSDGKADMNIFLIGDKTGLAVLDETHLVLVG